MIEFKSKRYSDSSVFGTWSKLYHAPGIYDIDFSVFMIRINGIEYRKVTLAAIEAYDKDRVWDKLKQ